MSLAKGRIAAAGALVIAASLAAGCAQMKDRQGYVMDDVLSAAVQPGVDNRDSVANTLGRPTFTGTFGERDWYYVSRSTQNLGFQKPRPVQQTVLHIRFDEAGNVVSVNRTGIDKVASVTPMKDETPTVGKKRGFFEELFGNIGAVGAPGLGGQGSGGNRDDTP